MSRSTTAHTLRQRFMSALAVLFVSLLAIIAVIFANTGMFRSSGSIAADELLHESEITVRQFERRLGECAAQTLELSRRLSFLLSHFFEERGLSMEDMNDRPDLLTEMQLSVADTIYITVQLARCSGVFFSAAATANSRLEEPSRSSIFMRYTNVFAERTSDTEIRLLRGVPEIAGSGGIRMHARWRMEQPIGFSQDADSITLSVGKAAGGDGLTWLLTRPISGSDTGELIRMLIAPVAVDGQIVGLCGMEFSSRLFHISNPTSDSSRFGTVFALMSREPDGTYTAQTADSGAGVLLSDERNIFVLGEPDGDGLVSVETAGGEYVGITRPIQTGLTEQLAVVMMPRGRLDSMSRRRVRHGAMIVVSALILLTAACCDLKLIFIDPIIRGIENIIIADSRSAAQDDEGIEELSTLRSVFGKLKKETFTDTLTGLSNRRGLRVMFDIMEDNKHSKKYTLAVCDIDRFKSINDTYGHDVGDLYIQGLADVLRSAHGMPPAERADAFRLGGDEFCVMFTDAGAEDAAEICRRLIVRFTELPVVSSTKVTTVSFGVAEWDGMVSPAELMKHADTALYRAKEKRGDVRIAGR